MDTASVLDAMFYVGLVGQVDVNGDGGLDMAELHRMCIGLGMRNISPEERQELMAELGKR